jgi:hypothetical protein
MRKSWRAALAEVTLALTGLLVAFPIPYAKADDCSTSRSGDRSYTDCYGPDGRSHTARLCFSEGDCYTDTWSDYGPNGRNHAITTCWSDGDCETDSYTEDQP